MLECVTEGSEGYAFFFVVVIIISGISNSSRISICMIIGTTTVGAQDRVSEQGYMVGAFELCIEITCVAEVHESSRYEMIGEYGCAAGGSGG